MTNIRNTNFVILIDYRQQLQGMSNVQLLTMRSSIFVLLFLIFICSGQSFDNKIKIRSFKSSVTFAGHSRTALMMGIRNDDLAKANREIRRAGANDRIVELRKPMGMDLDEDSEGNVFVRSIEENGRAAKSGVVFEGDYIRMVSATFGDDMWSCRGVGLTRVLSCIKVRNTKPVRFVLEAKTPQEEAKRRAVAFKELTPAEKQVKEAEDAELLRALKDEDKSLLKKRKGLFGLW